MPYVDEAVGRRSRPVVSLRGRNWATARACGNGWTLSENTPQTALSERSTSNRHSLKVGKKERHLQRPRGAVPSVIDRRDDMDTVHRCQLRRSFALVRSLKRMHDQRVIAPPPSCLTDSTEKRASCQNLPSSPCMRRSVSEAGFAERAGRIQFDDFGQAQYAK